MRPGQFNKNRNRNRNRNNHRSGGGSSNNNGGGNPANRVYDSNGPDVKVRGTAQTVAEKYMQLGRDAQSAGDIVMAESYYQHSEHYYRLWLANQPAGQPIQFARRGNEDEFEEEGVGEGGEGEDDSAEIPAAAEASPMPVADEGGDGAPVSGDAGQQPRQFRQREYRDAREPREAGDSQQQRDGGRGERFRSRWNRRDRNGNDGQREGNFRNRETSSDYQAERAPEAAPEAEAGNWEAPSFLTRPVPAIPAEVADDSAPVAAAERKPRGRKPKVEVSDTSNEEVAE